MDSATCMDIIPNQTARIKTESSQSHAFCDHLGIIDCIVQQAAQKTGITFSGCFGFFQCADRNTESNKWYKQHTVFPERIPEPRIFLHPGCAANQGIQSAPHRQIPVRQSEN